MFALLVGASMFVSCSNDDDENGGDGGPGTNATPVAAYNIQATTDLLALADVVVTYWDENGEQAKDTLDETSWTMAFFVTKSQQIGYSVSVTAKEDFDNLLTKDSYDLRISYSAMSGHRRDDGSMESYKNTGTSTNGHQAVPKAKVAEYIASKYFQNSYSASYSQSTDSFTSWQSSAEETDQAGN